MRYGSVCSGIEAATVAWHGLGWSAAWYSEIEPFPCAVLAHHYPTVMNLGDMTTLPERIRSGEVEAPDILCGGTPCQAFSVAGHRRSMDDARGNLSLTFCEVADAIDTVRLARGDNPAIIVWENVPGVLNTKDNAFGCFLAKLAGEDEAIAVEKWPRAGVVDGRRRRVAWAVLDAQYFGLAQRRRRVYVVAVAQETIRRSGDRADPAAILSIGTCLRGDSPSRSEPRPGAAGGAGQCFASGRESDIAATYDSRQPHNPQPSSTAQLTTQNCAFVRGDSPLVAQVAPAVYTLEIRGRGEDRNLEIRQDGTANALRTPNGGRDGINVGAIAVLPFDTPQLSSPSNYSAPQSGDPCHPLAAGAHPPAVVIGVDQEINASSVAYGTLKAKAVGGGFEGFVAIEPPAIAFHPTQDPIHSSDGTTHALGCGSAGGSASVAVATRMAVRRLTPRECERLQGFPDHYTAIPWRNKLAADCPDGPRYKALGNSWAVPVIRWIGQRIADAQEAAP